MAGASIHEPASLERSDLNAHARALGVRATQIEDGACTFIVPWAEHLVGDPDTGVLHGGVITAVLDNASGQAVTRSLLDPDNPSIATLDLRIDYQRPAQRGADLIVEASCYKVTRTIAFVRGIAHDGDREDPVATSVATFMLASSRVPHPPDAETAPLESTE